MEELEQARDQLDKELAHRIPSASYSRPLGAIALTFLGLVKLIALPLVKLITAKTDEAKEKK